MLCNSTVQDPVACPDGHLYCRACILESLLAQKKLIKQHIEQVDRREQEDEQERIRVKAEARERVLRDFERTQSALAGASTRDRTTPDQPAQPKPAATGGEGEADDGECTHAR